MPKCAKSLYQFAVPRSVNHSVNVAGLVGRYASRNAGRGVGHDRHNRQPILRFKNRPDRLPAAKQCSKSPTSYPEIACDDQPKREYCYEVGWFCENAEPSRPAARSDFLNPDGSGNAGSIPRRFNIPRTGQGITTGRLVPPVRDVGGLIVIASIAFISGKCPAEEGVK